MSSFMNNSLDQISNMITTIDDKDKIETIDLYITASIVLLS